MSRDLLEPITILFPVRLLKELHALRNEMMAEPNRRSSEVPTVADLIAIGAAEFLQHYRLRELRRRDIKPSNT
jgi:hypothetical protein